MIDFATVAGRVSHCLRTIADRGEYLTVGAIYNVARDVLSARVGSCVGTYYHHNAARQPRVDVLRVEIRDSSNPGEALIYLVNGAGQRVAHFGVMSNRDFEAKEAIEEVLAAFAEQSARVAA